MSLMDCCLTRLIEGTARTKRTVPRYGTLQILKRSTVRWYGTVKRARCTYSMQILNVLYRITIVARAIYVKDGLFNDCI